MGSTDDEQTGVKHGRRRGGKTAREAGGMVAKHLSNYSHETLQVITVQHWVYLHILHLIPNFRRRSNRPWRFLRGKCIGRPVQRCATRAPSLSSPPPAVRSLPPVCPLLSLLLSPRIPVRRPTPRRAKGRKMNGGGVHCDPQRRRGAAREEKRTGAGEREWSRQQGGRCLLHSQSTLRIADGGRRARCDASGWCADASRACSLACAHACVCACASFALHLFSPPTPRRPLAMLRRRALLLSCPLLVAASSAMHCLTPAAVAAQPATATAPAAASARAASSSSSKDAAAEADAESPFMSSVAATAARTSPSASASAPPPSPSGTGLVPRPLPVQLSKAASTPAPKRSDTGGFKHMFAGALAGMASKTILQPLDLVKVRLQVQDGTGKNEYKGQKQASTTRGEQTSMRPSLEIAADSLVLLCCPLSLVDSLTHPQVFTTVCSPSFATTVSSVCIAGWPRI